jgi:alpha-galactosidase
MIGLSFLRPLGLTICAGLLFAACERPARETAGAGSFPILTPPAAASPRINGARIYGSRPGSPFRFQVSVTGERPLEFTAENLPAGLAIDRGTGLISGTLRSKGRTVVRLKARNRLGTAEKALTIVGGEEIGLTPPMGWNSWNCWGSQVSEEKVRAAARAMAASGLRDHGWTYVNIDDGWQGARGGSLQAIQPNARFPRMGALADEVHALGLKIGIYSTPWRVTSARYRGSTADRPNGEIDTPAGVKNSRFQVPDFHSRFGWLGPLADWRRARARKKFVRGLQSFGSVSFVRQDVRQWSAWGFDYLKYDWVPIDLPHVAEMSAALEASGRDIFYSLSNNAKRPLAPELTKLANSWRTTVDIEDTWASVSDLGFSRDKWAPFNGPGHYNDPDMLVLGDTKWHRPNGCPLTADEQYAHMSLWCLLSGPLLLGCDLEKLDPFTLGLLTNDEVLEVNQDPLCRQATRVARDVYGKQMENGDWAVGLFNRGTKPATIAVQWSDLGLTTVQRVRDLWRQKDLGEFADRFEASVAPHGVVLLRIAPRPR